ncbi:MAG: Hsp33 family molecular chaperone HslO [Synergistales bacterium]
MNEQERPIACKGEPMAVVSRGLLAGGNFRIFAVKADGLLEESMRKQNLSPLAAAALGRLMMASMMMALDIKLKKARVTLKLDGGGPLGLVVADAEPQGRVRGYVAHPEVDLPPSASGKLDVAAGVGRNGTISVFRDVRLKEPISSQVPLLSGEVAEDVAQYYRLSEQTATAVGLGVLASPGRVFAAGGYMVQVLPGALDPLIGAVEERVRNTPAVSRFLEAHADARNAMEDLFRGMDIEWFDDVEFSSSCRCSRELARAILKGSAGEGDPGGASEVRCHFCGTTYRFEAEELNGALGETVAPNA